EGRKRAADDTDLNPDLSVSSVVNYGFLPLPLPPLLAGGPCAGRSCFCGCSCLCGFSAFAGAPTRSPCACDGLTGCAALSALGCFCCSCTTRRASRCAW